MSTEIKYWYLRSHQLFTVLNNSQIKQLCIITGFKKARKGEVIHLGSDGVPRIYFLKKGHIKIAEMDDKGNEVTKEIIRKGDLFGELSLDPSGGSREYAQVLTDDVTICSFLLSDFEALMARHPALAVSYTRLVGLRFRKVSNNYSNLVFRDARSRLLFFLKEWVEREGAISGKSAVLKNYLTQQDVAQIICTTRQTAAQLFSELEAEGLLQYNRKEILINDIAALG